jgi:hypothetical protein
MMNLNFTNFLQNYNSNNVYPVWIQYISNPIPKILLSSQLSKYEQIFDIKTILLPKRKVNSKKYTSNPEGFLSEYFKFFQLDFSIYLKFSSDISDFVKNSSEFL